MTFGHYIISKIADGESPACKKNSAMMKVSVERRSLVGYLPESTVLSLC
jgi:hypothetical protein